MSLFAPDDLVRRLSLVRLSGVVARSLAGVGRVATEGEVVKPSVRPSGRIWFTLRDRAVQVTVVCPPARARRCRVVHGERVEVTGSLAWMADRGQLQLVAEEVVPVGAGAIAAALAETRERLAAAGLLERPRRPLPRLPAAVGVVCGSDAAVRADIESVVSARFPGYPLVFQEVTVSGPGAADAIVRGLEVLQADPRVEVVVLARGGGDAAALLPWSDEELCRAIARSPKPVVSAIGHDGDRPLCDEVADLRCGTPSLAAAAVVPEEGELRASLDGLLTGASRTWEALVTAGGRRLGSVEREPALRAGLALARQRMVAAEGGLAAVDMGSRLGAAGRALDALDWRGPVGRRLEGAGTELQGLRLTVEALDPARVLARGYAVVRGPAGNVLRSPAEVVAGDLIDVRLAHGGLRAAVAAAPGEGRP